MPRHLTTAELLDAVMGKSAAVCTKLAKDDDKKKPNSRTGGRWLALHALDSQRGLRHPTANTVGTLGDVLTHGGIAGSPIRNAVVTAMVDDPRAELLDIVRTAKKRKGHFGASFMGGVRRMAVPAAVAGTLVGARRYFTASPHEHPGDLRTATIAHGLGAAAGTAMGGGLVSSLADTILGRTTDETNDRSVDRLIKRPVVQGLSGGGIFNAISS